VDAAKCADGCSACVPVCPTEGHHAPAGQPVALDLGAASSAPPASRFVRPKAITQTGDHRMAVRRREDLVLGEPGQEQVRLAAALDEKLAPAFWPLAALRQVSAGGCNACEADTNVLGTIGWDLGRFGIQFVASPRHADGLLITGPVSKNMELALKKTYAAVPEPKIVIAVGACAIAGGPFVGNPQILNGAGARSCR
jgi:ferredoxin